MYYINTSNPLKLSQYKKYLGDQIHIETKDIVEPDSDPITIIRYKASQFQNVLVDDTSLEIEGANFGSNIKWLIKELPKYSGKAAQFICLVAIRIDQKVFIYQGIVKGTIVQSRGPMYGFLSYFEPCGTDKTLAEEHLDCHNARFYAVQNFLKNKPFLITQELPEWRGDFQANK